MQRLTSTLPYKSFVVAADRMFLYERRRIATLAVQAMLPVVTPSESTSMTAV